MKLISNLIIAVLLVLYWLLAQVMIYFTSSWTTPAVIAMAVLFAVFMMVTLNMIFKSLPKSISNYYLNDP